MTIEERLRQQGAPRATVAVSQHVLDLLRQSASADAQQQVRQINTTREQEKTKKQDWHRGR